MALILEGDLTKVENMATRKGTNMKIFTVFVPEFGDVVKVSNFSNPELADVSNIKIPSRIHMNVKLGYKGGLIQDGVIRSLGSKLQVVEVEEDLKVAN